MAQTLLYKNCKKTESKKLIKVSAGLFNNRFDPEKTTVMKAPLPFYTEYSLVELSDHHVSPAFTRYFLNGDKGDVMPLTNNGSTIGTLNKNGALTLNVDTVEEYIRFYFNNTVGPKGKYILVETIDDIDWIEIPSSGARRALSNMITQMIICESTKDGHLLEATMIFKTGLFDVTLYVSPEGDIAIKEQDLIIDVMQVKDTNIV